MRHSKFCTIVLTLVLIFLYLPVAVLIANSFNMSKYGGEWAGFTLKWYGALFSPSNREIWMAFERSLIIAGTATLASCVLGTTAAIALHRWRGRRHQSRQCPDVHRARAQGAGQRLSF